MAKDEPPKAEPDDTARGEAKEETGNAERSRPAAEGKSNEAKSSDIKPADVKPADVKPSDVKPVEAKPAEAKPAEAKSTEPKSTEAKSDSGKTEAPKDGPAGDKAIVRRDPVPPVTPAPPAVSTATPLSGNWPWKST